MPEKILSFAFLAYPAEAFVYKFRWSPKIVGDDGNGNPTDATSDDEDAQKTGV